MIFPHSSRQEWLENSLQCRHWVNLLWQYLDINILCFKLFQGYLSTKGETGVSGFPGQRVWLFKTWKLFIKKRLYYNQSQCINQLSLHQEHQEMDICLFFFFFFSNLNCFFGVISYLKFVSQIFNQFLLIAGKPRTKWLARTWGISLWLFYQKCIGICVDLRIS